MAMSSVVNIFKLGFDVSIASHIPHSVSSKSSVIKDHSTSSKSSSSELTDTDKQDQWAAAGRGRRCVATLIVLFSLFGDCGENMF